MFLLGLIFFVILVVVFFRRRYRYWHSKGVPQMEPTAPFGNLDNMFRRTKNLAIHFNELYEEMKGRGWRHCGLYFFTAPVYYPADLDLLKNIMAKDFQYFSDRGFYYNERDDPLSANLLALGGPKWHKLRTKLSPTFTSSKMKQMFPILLQCTKALEAKLDECDQAVDIREILACFTTDIIGSCAFGLECNTFKDEKSPFRLYWKQFVERDLFRNLKQQFAENFPNVARSLGIIHIPKDVSRFFFDVVKSAVEEREQQGFLRNDFLQLLIDLKNSDEGLTLEEVAAQCFIFFLGGFETSSTVMTFALYELAKHPQIQEKVRDEITTVLAQHDGQITYDTTNNLKYMDQVIDETLRKYPPVPFFTRECVKHYKIPGEDVVIEPGTRVLIPVMGIHYDPQYYPNPDQFDPDRFSEEQKSLRNPYAYIPFGQGPRNCIGMRFGLMQTRVGLTVLLKNYQFAVSPRNQEPLKFVIEQFFLCAVGDTWLDVQKIS